MISTKKIALALLIFSFCSISAFSEVRSASKINKIEKEIKKLELNAKKAKRASEKNKINNKISVLKSEIEEIRLSDVQPGPAPVAVDPRLVPKSYGLDSIKKPVVKKEKKIQLEKNTPKRLLKPRMEMGFGFGVLGGIYGGVLEIKSNYIFGSDNLSSKAGLMYAQGEDLNKQARKNLLLFYDGIYNFDPYMGKGIKSYIGGGINYLAYTTGKVSGTFGGEVYLGFENKIGNTDFVYLELGYGAIRTGFSPSFKGANALLGVRSKF